MLRWRIKESDGGIKKRGVFLTILDEVGDKDKKSGLES